jgi:hypothetical protein
MKKEAYLAGVYKPGTPRFKMAQHMFGPISAPAPVEEVVKPEAKKKTVKKAAKKKSED